MGLVPVLVRYLTRGALRAAQSIAARLANLGHTPAREYQEDTAHDLHRARWLAQRLHVREHVLDIGCGNAHLLRKLKLFVDIQATGIDLAPPASSIAEINVLPFDGERVPFDDQSFDVSIFGYVLHHLNREHAGRLLAEAIRVTRRKIFVLEDSMPTFSWLYRLRNRWHHAEAALEYSGASSSYRQGKREEMFLTHDQWREFLGGFRGVTGIHVHPLDFIYKYAHHTCIELDCTRT